MYVQNLRSLSPKHRSQKRPFSTTKGGNIQCPKMSRTLLHKRQKYDILPTLYVRKRSLWWRCHHHAVAPQFKLAMATTLNGNLSLITTFSGTNLYLNY